MNNGPVNHRSTLSWFGKLPSLGDFCSNNMSADLQATLDHWLSEAMQLGPETHGAAWIHGYFQAAIHGFALGPQTLLSLGGQSAVGVIMPSVDKAGRAFPFVLMQVLQAPTLQCLSTGELSLWFAAAQGLCAKALYDEWTLEQLDSALHGLPNLNKLATLNKADLQPLSLDNTLSQWYRIEFEGPIQWIMQCAGLPRAQAFDTLLGLGTPT